MWEQSFLHGRLFHGQLGEKSVKTEPVSWDSLSFGPMRLIRIGYISDREVWVSGRTDNHWYHYTGDSGHLPLVGEQDKDPDLPACFTYYYGRAKDGSGAWGDYFVQNVPPVTETEIPDIHSFEIPLTLQAMDYDRTFSYPPEIKDLLSAFPACYVDRYKRPVQRARGRTYPVAMEKVSTYWRDLPETSYPVVVSLKDSPFAVADLEPEHTPNEKAYFDSLPGWYVERTIRGGYHKLVGCDTKQYKYRRSKNLELLNETQSTFYGIDAEWLSDKPEPLDLTGWEPVGNSGTNAVRPDIPVTARKERPDVERLVWQLRKKADERVSTARARAEALYRADEDLSHGEYAALRALYEQDVAPYRKQIAPDLLPWVLEAYAEGIIPYREKHGTMRQGLPYLVYLGAVIIERKDGCLLWRTENQSSS